MFTKMGVPNGEMALFTSLLYLPWTLKPLWSPLVDIFRTKRWWIVMMNEHAYIDVHLHIDPVRDNRLCLGDP